MMPIGNPRDLTLDSYVKIYQLTFEIGGGEYTSGHLREVVMANSKSVEDVTEEIFQSILATPKRQRRLKSSTLWDMFGFKMRTKERVERVRAAFESRSITTRIDGAELGSEPKGAWIILSHLNPDPPPPVIDTVDTPEDDWFDIIVAREFESEREVEHYFVVPLLEKLGYREDDIAIGYPVEMFEGVKRVKKEADVVLFRGGSRARENALLVVEAKKHDKILTDAMIGQARAYALWLSTPFYVVTNGDEVRVFLFRGAIMPDVMHITFKRRELKEYWERLFSALNRQSVIDYKERLKETLAP